MNTITWNALKENTNLSIEEIRDRLLCPALGLEKEERGLSRGNCSKLFSGSYVGITKRLLERMAREARNPENGFVYTPENYPYLQGFRRSWGTIEEAVSQEQLESVVKRLCEQTYEISFTHRGFSFCLSDALQDLQLEADTLQKLAVLSVIACTWTIWVHCSDTDSQKDKKTVNKVPYAIADSIDIYRGLLLLLAQMIFPLVHRAFQQARSECPEAPGEWNNPDELFESGLSYYHKGAYQEAGECFAELVCCHLTEAPQRLADACGFLLKCCDNGFQRPDYLRERESIERMAVFYGSTSVRKRHHEIIAKIPRSRTATQGRCIINCGNALSELVRQTAPTQWECVVSLQPYAHMELGMDTRFVLIDDDFERNCKDALLILEEIRQMVISGDLDSRRLSQIEIVIRCREESVTALLDTAYSLVEECCKEEEVPLSQQPIRIYPLDEEKRTADILFARHPLYYPLTVPYTGRKGECTCNHLVIVSDNENLNYASWLVREAFWLLPRGKTEYSSKITVLSPFAREIAWQVTSACPGLASFSSTLYDSAGAPERMQTSVNVKINGISFADIEYRTVSLQSRAFQTQLEELTDQGEALYYVVDAGSDIDAITLGTKIREMTIRRKVLRTEFGREISRYSSDAVVVAVRCEDPDCAGLAENLIVPKEPEREMVWNHSYRLLTFGSRKDLFSWDELTGGILEFMSQCIHRQYCSQGNNLDFSTPVKQGDVWSYFRRLYNHDSSYAAAVGLPYRLFEADVMPEPWEIRNPEALWSAESRKELAYNYDEARKQADVEQHLAKYEHIRWCCYMLSRGWLPVNPDQVFTYMNAGVSRHVLQIAKLHPCLVSWQDLKTLYINLHARYLGPADAYGKHRQRNERFCAYAADDVEYFQKIDLNNIKQTGDILRANPTRSREEIER